MKEEEIKASIKLEVGSRIYRTNYGQISEVVTIERLTNTMAITKNDNYKFAIDVSSYGFVKKIGNTDKWSNASYQLETPELRQKLWRQNAIQKLKNIDFSTFEDSILKDFIAIINK